MVVAGAGVDCFPGTLVLGHQRLGARRPGATAEDGRVLAVAGSRAAFARTSVVLAMSASVAYARLGRYYWETSVCFR